MSVFAQNQPLEKISFFSCVFLNFCLRFFIVFHIIFMFFSCTSMPAGMDFCSRGSFKTTPRDHSKQPAKPKPKAKRSPGSFTTTPGIIQNAARDHSKQLRDYSKRHPGSFTTTPRDHAKRASGPFKTSPGIIQNNTWIIQTDSPGSFKPTPRDHSNLPPGSFTATPLGSFKTPPGIIQNSTPGPFKTTPGIIQNDPRDHSQRPPGILQPASRDHSKRPHGIIQNTPPNSKR